MSILFLNIFVELKKSNNINEKSLKIFKKLIKILNILQSKLIKFKSRWDI
nr:MAG TPA: hypothetical protein [Caudoviricetes sp.]